jgi:predicted MFS family arabinose efflux permease
VLVVTYVSAGVALAMMSTAVSITQFAVIAFFLTIAYAADAVTPALITDLVAKEHLDRWMSIITTARWVGAIVGYSGTGYAVEYVGLSMTLLASALVPLLAVILVIQVRRAKVQEAPASVLLAAGTVAGD